MGFGNEPTRDELNDIARAAGVPDPEGFDTKDDLQEAIDSVNPPPEPPDEDEDVTGRPSLGEVAEERADNRNVRRLPARKEG